MNKKFLSLLALAAKKTAIHSGSATSWLDLYQPVEPESVRKVAEERRQAKLAKKMAKKK